MTLHSKRFALALLFSLLFTLPSFAQVAVTYSNVINTTTEADGGITKTGGGGGFDASALSTQQLTQAGESFTFTVVNQAAFVIGVSTDNTANNIMPFALSFAVGGIVEVRENGAYSGDTTYVAGDTFTLEVVGTTIHYKKNGSTFASNSSNTVTLPINLDIAISTAAAGLTSATYTAISGGGSDPQITVCTAGCDFNNSQLQTALNAAIPGGEVLLERNHEYTGQFTLPAVAGIGTNWITVRTGV